MVCVDLCVSTKLKMFDYLLRLASRKLNMDRG